MTSSLRLPSSWRDPNGFAFSLHGRIYRAVNQSYASEYKCLVASGLYDRLTTSGKLIAHEELDPFPPFDNGVYKILLPLQIPVVTYPYEWCFSQLKDAAMLTLEIQHDALNCGMSLKDANAFNVQFLNGHPIFIDTLSFEKYTEGAPWIAYRQFCECFFAPLCLMAFTHGLYQRTLLAFLDGIPLSVASATLPWPTLLRPSTLLHVHLHSLLTDYYSGEGPVKRGAFLGKSALLRIIGNLRSAIQRLKLSPAKSHWQRYYSTCSYPRSSFEHKMSAVRAFLEDVQPDSVWDLGANTGEFSLISARLGIHTVALDSDPGCIEAIYERVRRESIANLLPVVTDLVSPSPTVGWDNEERIRILDRCRPDLIMCLALIHHLAIARNVPLEKIARLLARLARYLIVEFVPKDDPQSLRLLKNRVDIFPDYSPERFEQIFGQFYQVKSKVRILESPRCLYLMRTRE